MTTRFYSPSTKGFYSDDVHKTAEERPDDCFEVSDEQFRSLLEAQEAGKEITWDATSAEFRTAPPPITMATIRAARNKKLASTDWTQGRDVPTALSEKWADYRQSLRNIPQVYEGRPQDVVWPQTPV